MFWKCWTLNFCSRNKRTVVRKAVDKKSTKRTRKNKKYVLGQKVVGQLSYTPRSDGTVTGSAQSYVA